MALKILDRVAFVTTTMGTGTVDVGAEISEAFMTPAEAGISNGDTAYYLISEGDDFEIGLGTYSSTGPTFARTSVSVSKIGGSVGTTKMTLAGAAVVRFVASAALLDLIASFGTGNAFTKFTGPASTEKTMTLPNASSTIRVAGLETKEIPAQDWTPNVTNGCGRSYAESTTNKWISETIDFDTTTQEFATFAWEPPKKYNGGTITFRYKHRLPSASAAQTVVMGLSAVFLRDDDAWDTAAGTVVTVTDTFIATGDIHISATSSAVTPAGTYAAGCKVMLKLQRNVASDDAAGDALVSEVDIFFTSNAADDT